MAMPASPTFFDLDVSRLDWRQRPHTSPRVPLSNDLADLKDKEPDTGPRHPSLLVPLIVDLAYELRSFLIDNCEVVMLSTAYLLIVYADGHLFSPFDPDASPWLNLFGLMFELSSA